MVPALKGLNQTAFISFVQYIGTYPILVKYYTTTADDALSHTVTRHALKYIEVTRLVVSLGRYHTCGTGVPDNNVCIRTYSYPTLQ